MEPIVRVFPSPGEMAPALSDRLARCLGEGGTALLAGGTSPLASYRFLAERDYLPWDRVTFIPTDERVLPREDPQRNDRNLRAIFGARSCSIRELPFGESGEFELFLRSRVPFAVTLLGLGEDGHTASLFPGGPDVGTEDWLIRIHNAPKPPSERVSLVPRALESTRCLIFCVTGTAKKGPLERLLKGEDIPPNRLSPWGPVYIYCDRAALM